MELKTFNIYKLFQMLYYFQKNIKNCNNYMQLIKLIFFADRYHLRNYGIPSTFDNYLALKLGPAGSLTKDILTLNDFFLFNLSGDTRNFIKKNLKKYSHFKVKIGEQKDDLLSESDREALDFTIKNFGNFTEFQLADITHDYPEWKKFQEIFKNHSSGFKSMNYADFFNNPNIQKSPFLKKYFKGIDPFTENEDMGILKLRQEEFIKYNKDLNCE